MELEELFNEKMKLFNEFYAINLMELMQLT